LSHLTGCVLHSNNGVHSSTEPDCLPARSVFLRCSSGGELYSDRESSGGRHNHCQRSSPVQDNHAGSATKRSR